MKRTTIATTLGAALSLVAFVGAAQARNMHCAGGIQYVVQGMNDKTRGSLDDYKREMTAVESALCANWLFEDVVKLTKRSLPIGQ